MQNEPKRKPEPGTMASDRPQMEKQLADEDVRLDNNDRAWMPSANPTLGTLKASFLFAVIFATPCCKKPSAGTERLVAQDDAPAVLVSATSPPARLGDEAKNPYFRIRVLNSKRCSVEAHLDPPPGLRKVAVEVELGASGTQEIPANPFYALLKDRDGRQFESTLAGCPPLLPAARLRSGQSVRGWITFDVPEGSEPYSLVYQPAVIGVDPPRAELLLGP